MDFQTTLKHSIAPRNEGMKIDPNRIVKMFQGRKNTCLGICSTKKVLKDSIKDGNLFLEKTMKDLH